MNNFLERLELQIGSENIKKLNKCHIALFGLGGVGSYCAEILARSGIGEITIVDKDVIDASNINRQLFALHSTINQNKIDICENRLLDINPNLIIHKYKLNFNIYETRLAFDKFNYVIDAIDDLQGKLAIIQKAKQANTKVITCTGTGNKLNPSSFRIDDISKSNTCPLAKLLRKQLHSLNITNVKCLYSTEPPLKMNTLTISSNAFTPSIAGILIAREVILEICEL